MIRTSGPRLITTLFWITMLLIDRRVVDEHTFVRSLGMIAVRSLGARKSRDETKMKLDGAPNSMRYTHREPRWHGSPADVFGSGSEDHPARRPDLSRDPNPPVREDR